MSSKTLDKALDLITITLILILANVRAFRILPLYPETDSILGQAWREVLLWLVTSGLVFWQLSRHGLLNRYFSAWRDKWPLAIFVGLAFLSLVWSISFSATLYRSLVLFFATILGAYIGIRFNIRWIMKTLFWFGAIIMILCFSFALILPDMGISKGFPYYGAWTGIFWHRNHMGIILSLLNMVFLMRIIKGLSDHDSTAILDSVFYLLSILLIFLTRSATAEILLIFLNCMVFLVWAWLKVRHALKAWHYFLLLGIFVLVVILLIIKLDFVLGIFNRSSSLTGRVPMWGYLFGNVIEKRLWLGYGFGAFWTFEATRVQLAHAVGWVNQVLIGDNGFIDIMIHVGIVGFGIFLVNIIYMVTAAIKIAFRRLTLEFFFPGILMAFAIVANISFSLFLELEAFVWMLMVAVWFASSKELEQIRTE